MKCLYPIAFILLTVSLAFTPAPSAQDMVEKGVLNWASTTFEFYDGPRFENFHEVPSQEQFLLEAKITSMQEFIAEQDAMFKAGEINKTQQEFDASQKKLLDKVKAMETNLQSMDASQKCYEIHFWANIRVSNAVTVYYQHLLQVDSKFNVTAARITGKVGGQGQGVTIVYKNTATIYADKN